MGVAKAKKILRDKREELPVIEIVKAAQNMLVKAKKVEYGLKITAKVLSKRESFRMRSSTPVSMGIKMMRGEKDLQEFRNQFFKNLQNIIKKNFLSSLLGILLYER